MDMLDNKKDVREIILFVHNMQQSLVLLDKSISDNRKLLKNVIQARENTRRAGNEILKIKEKLFETRAEKLLFLNEVNKIADYSANIAEIFISASMPSNLTKKIVNITSKISDLSKNMDFASILKTENIVKSLNELRNKVNEKDLDAKTFYSINKVLDYLKQIVYGLEKVNQF